MIPTNEMELVILFAQQAEGAGFEIIKAQVAFPDAIVKRDEVEYRVEFEYRASNFWTHRHNPADCDLVICWINDDEYPVLPVLALSESGWAEQEIILPPFYERLAGYWKARALEAEKALNPIPDQESVPTDNEMRIVSLWNEGVPKTKIGEIVFGCKGGKQNKKVGRVLAKLVSEGECN